ncbi:MAG: MMPL family transporter, partial [Opitutaceae bacterium]
MSLAQRLVGIVESVVDYCRRHAAIVAAGVLAAAVGLAFYAVRRVGLDSNTETLMSPGLPWRRADIELNREFPQNKDLLAAVIDGATPDQAEDASARLAAVLRAQPDLFRDVRQPDGGLFFRKNGFLFLSPAAVRAMADNLIAAQPMLGTLAADPSARGVFEALDLFAQGAIQGDVAPALLARP